MEQKLNDLSEKMMKKVNENFMAASSLLLPAIHDELSSHITTGGADIFQMDRYS